MTRPTPDTPGALNWALILALGVIWGSAFLSVRVALDGFTALQTAAGRTLFGALALTAISLVMGQGPHRLPSARAYGFAVAIGGFAVALPFVLLSWGQQFVPSAFAGVAMGAVPLLVLPLVYVFSPEEGIGPRRIIGITLGFVGLLALIGPSAFGDDTASFTGQLACVGAALCYAAGSITTRRAPKMPPIAFATVTLLAAALILAPLALWIDGMPMTYPARSTMALLYAALFPTALAAVIRVLVITSAGSLFMSNTSYMVPVWSVIFGIAILGEDLPPGLFAGLALILAGIAISQSRQRGKAR